MSVRGKTCFVSHKIFDQGCHLRFKTSPAPLRNQSLIIHVNDTPADDNNMTGQPRDITTWQCHRVTSHVYVGHVIPVIPPTFHHQSPGMTYRAKSMSYYHQIGKILYFISPCKLSLYFLCALLLLWRHNFVLVGDILVIEVHFGAHWSPR